MAFFHAFYCFVWVHLALFGSKSGSFYRSFPPCHRFFRSQIGVLLWLVVFQHCNKGDMLVGWLVNSVCLALIVSDKLWLADRPLSHLFLIKCYHQTDLWEVLRVFETLSKHAFFGDFWKIIFLLFSPPFSGIVATFSTTLHVKQF